MKRFKALLLCLVMALMVVGAAGCEKETKNEFLTNDFVEVASISFIKTTSENTRASEIILNFGKGEKITEEEYLQFENEMTYENDKNGRLNIDRDKSNLKKYQELVGKTVAYQRTEYDMSLVGYVKNYYKAVFESIETKYILVKIVDNRSFYIKDTSNSLSYITCQSYQVDFFI